MGFIRIKNCITELERRKGRHSRHKYCPILSVAPPFRAARAGLKPGATFAIRTYQDTGTVDRRDGSVLHFWHMSDTITVRLNPELATWLKETARRTGVPAGRIIREQLEKARAEGGSRRFLSHAGKISGPRDLSSREGFKRS